MLAVKNLEVVYQDVILVLRGISFEIPKGEIVSLLGSNGSGKTTALRAITGLLDTQNGDITKGQILVEDEDITNAEPSKIVNLGIAQVLEGRRIFSELTVTENLRLGGFTNNDAVKENMERVFNLFPILEEKQKQIVGELSGGQRQQVAVGRALMTNPKLRMLNVPTAGVSPIVVKELFEKIINIAKAGIAILMVEQNAKQALEISDNGFVLVQGENKFTDKGITLLENREVRKAFLGG